MTSIFYTKFYDQLPKKIEQEYLALLPPAFFKKNRSYKFWKDRHRHLFGVLLLIEALKQHNQPIETLHEINYSEYKRPIMVGPIDFNISHSENYAVCAIAENANIGVDIEYQASIYFNEVRSVMNPEQWDIITRSCHPIETFFRYWTIKESVVKADGRGMHIDLCDIEIVGNKAFLDGKTWYLTLFDLLENANICLASDQQDAVKTCEINFYKKSL